MSAKGKVVHEVGKWSGRYDVESIQDSNAYRYTYHMSTADLQTAITEAESLVHKHGHIAARVVDTETEEEEA